ncbi:MAG: pyridoxamine 5'-phosphate oxidase family protein [Clostridiales bacterium]|nr:pyridoxamine 5'-phosphate oxidase family protein [Clostridiales bacterium]
MRRRDREVTDPKAILTILKEADIARLAFNVPNEAPYIVPMNFGYAYENGNLRLVFHGAKEGRKLDLLKADARVGFELDCPKELVTADESCGYSIYFASIIGVGKAAILTDDEARKHAIDLLMLKVAGKTMPINEQVLAKTCIFEVVADSFSAKAKTK